MRVRLRVGVRARVRVRARARVRARVRASSRSTLRRSAGCLSASVPSSPRYIGRECVVSRVE